jgi:hypothetical protein
VNNPRLVDIKRSFFLWRHEYNVDMVLRGNLNKVMYPLGVKVRDAVKCTGANGYYHEKKNQCILGTDMGYRFM